jgi:hypothetical protein
VKFDNIGLAAIVKYEEERRISTMKDMLNGKSISLYSLIELP